MTKRYENTDEYLEEKFKEYYLSDWQKIEDIFNKDRCHTCGQKILRNKEEYFDWLASVKDTP